MTKSSTTRYLPTTYANIDHKNASNYDILDLENGKKNNFSLTTFSDRFLPIKHTKNKNNMNEADLIQVVSQYVTYDEFVKNCPEIDIGKNEWYEICKGNNYQTNKRLLKQAYISQFEADWQAKRARCFRLMNNE